MSDYIGRTVDVLAYHGAGPDSEALLYAELATDGTGGEICAGPQKLAQRFLIRFFTIVGSIQYLPAVGCEFMGHLLRGELQTAADVFLAFSQSASDLKTQLQAEESSTDPDDERFSKAELVSVGLGDGLVLLRMRLTTRAGTNAKILLPVAMSL